MTRGEAHGNLTGKAKQTENTDTSGTNSQLTCLRKWLQQERICVPEIESERAREKEREREGG